MTTDDRPVELGSLQRLRWALLATAVTGVAAAVLPMVRLVRLASGTAPGERTGASGAPCGWQCQVSFAGTVALCSVTVVAALFALGFAAPLRAALDRQRRFVTDVTHDLRSPVSRLHTRSQMILRYGHELPEPVVDELRRLVEGSRDLAEVVDDVLRAAVLTPGGGEPERVDLAGLAAELLAAEEVRLRERGVQARLRTDPRAVTAVDGIRGSLKRALSALLDNALAHTPAGGQITVTVSPSPERRGTVDVVVQDNGVGFGLEQQRRLFVLFAHGSGGTGERHGIGLSLVRAIVESHGGTVTATGTPGVGAKFTIRLPVAGPEATSTGGDSNRR